MHFDLVIFDCDGVLVDSELISCRCLVETLRGHGIEATLEEVFASFLGRSTPAIVAHYRRAGHVVPEAFPAELRARVRQAFAAELRPIENIETVLRRLGGAGCVASSSDLDRVEHPIAACMALAERLKERFGLRFCGVSKDASGGSGTNWSILRDAA